jgi:hypothetical protein
VRRVALRTPLPHPAGGCDDHFPAPLRSCVPTKRKTKPNFPYLARQMSEEISSRVVESTRLILVKDGFGGDSGVLDRLRMNARKTQGFRVVRAAGA